MAENWPLLAQSPDLPITEGLLKRACTDHPRHSAETVTARHEVIRRILSIHPEWLNPGPGHMYPLGLTSDIRTARLLIELGSDPTLMHPVRSALHMAAYNQNLPLVRFYLEMGMSLDWPDGNGTTSRQLLTPRNIQILLNDLDEEPEEGY